MILLRPTLFEKTALHYHVQVKVEPSSSLASLFSASSRHLFDSNFHHMASSLASESSFSTCRMRASSTSTSLRCRSRYLRAAIVFLLRFVSPPISEHSAGRFWRFFMRLRTKSTSDFGAALGQSELTKFSDSSTHLYVTGVPSEVGVGLVELALTEASLDSKLSNAAKSEPRLDSSPKSP